MAIVISCPKCGIRLTLGDDRAGTSLECPRCGQQITMPTINTTGGQDSKRAQHAADHERETIARCYFCAKGLHNGEIYRTRYKPSSNACYLVDACFECHQAELASRPTRIPWGILLCIVPLLLFLWHPAASYISFLMLFVLWLVDSGNEDC
jgi:phage FluMu protein Com